MRREYLILLLVIPLALFGFNELPLGTVDPANPADETQQSSGVPVQTVGQTRVTDLERDGFRTAGRTLRICSFNVQFLGNSTARDNKSLTALLQPFDVVAVQELVSPPFPGFFPDGTPFRPDAESAAFFEEMASLGFQWVLSEEDTGTGDNIHRNGSSTEWWVCFYRPEKLAPANDLPHGFLAEDRSNHPSYERVPYAFAFRTPDGRADFVLISVHLQPGSRRADRARRAVELSAINDWITSQSPLEQDFIILGDMNLEDAEEVEAVTPRGFVSLNNECRPTNTNLNGPKPYDHVMYAPEFTSEIDTAFDMQVVNLIDELAITWTSTEPYPGDPYDHNLFRAYYSDHHPVVFQMTVPTVDDDGPLRVAGGTLEPLN